MKKFIYSVLAMFLVMACEKDEQNVTLTYRLSNAIANTDISFRAADGQLMYETIQIESMEDVWTKPFEMNKGDIVYLSAIYVDSVSSVKLQILVDGKVYKEASSNQNPDQFIIVSGTIPY